MNSDITILPDGSGFFVGSLPLPKNHWIFDDVNEVPNPNALNMLRSTIINAARYAIRSSTMHGKEMDFDPDAMVSNFLIGMLGRNSDDNVVPNV